MHPNSSEKYKERSQCGLHRLSCDPVHAQHPRYQLLLLISSKLDAAQIHLQKSQSHQRDDIASDFQGVVNTGDAVYHFFFLDRCQHCE